MSANHTVDSRLLTIRNDCGLSGVFSAYGAGVKSLMIHDVPFVLDPLDESDYFTSARFYGKTLGRVAGRIPCEYKIGSNTYHLPENEPGLCLHGGGEDGFAFKTFSVSIDSNDPDYTSVIFSGLSKDGDCGFPGNLRVTVTYSMCHSRNELIIRHEAVTDEYTIVSLSNHMYFLLPGSKNVNEHSLQINSSLVSQSDEGSLMIKRYVDLPESLSFKESIHLKERLDSLPKGKTIDHAFIFDSYDPKIPQVVLENDKLRLECYTDYPAANIYVQNGDKGENFANGKRLKTRRGIAIEPQLTPLSDITLRPGVKYSHYIKYCIKEK